MARESVFQDGPHLAAAFLCERLLEEKDGAKSAIRIHDRVIQTAKGTGVPERMPTVTASPTLYLSFKNGKQRGKHEIKIRLERPNGVGAPDVKHTINLDGGDNAGRDMRIQLNLKLEEEGLYWFEIYFDEFLLTRVPLQVIYLIQTTESRNPEPVM